MKYILMMSGKKSDFDGSARWSTRDLQASVAFLGAFGTELKDSGVFVSTEGLGWPGEAKLVRAGENGEPVTEKVFPETKEFLAAFWIIDVDSPDQACKIAARASQAPGAGGKPASIPIEVRPLLSGHADLGI